MHRALRHGKYGRQSAAVKPVCPARQIRGDLHEADFGWNGCGGGAIRFGLCGRQAASWVVGLEGDFSSLRFRQSATITGNPHAGFDNGSSIFKDQVSADWLATVRGRVGYAYDRLLFYGTAGVAFAHSNLQSSIRDLAPNAIGFGTALVSASPIKVGWAAGAGIDYAVANNWIVSVEYLHADLGKVNAAGLIKDENPLTAKTAAVAYSAKLTSDIVRAGIGYKF